MFKYCKCYFVNIAVSQLKVVLLESNQAHFKYSFECQHVY